MNIDEELVEVFTSIFNIEENFSIMFYFQQDSSMKEINDTLNHIEYYWKLFGILIIEK